MVEGHNNPSTEQTVLSPSRAYAAIMSMAFGSFAYGTNEFVTAGFLPEIAKTFSISISTAGWVTTTSFMLGAAISAPIVAISTVNVPRRQLVIALTTSLVLSAIASAWSPNFEVLILGRLLASFSQAAYMGVGSVVSASLVPKSKESFAVSLFFTGLTLSNLVGVPLDTFFGEESQWRYAFLPVCGLVALAALGQFAFLPQEIHYTKPDFRNQFGIFKKLSFWLAFATSAFGYSGMLASHTYFADMMIKLAGYSQKDISWLTLVYGAGTVVGNILGGKAADKNLNFSVASLLIGLAVVLATYTFSTYYKISAVVSLFLNGLAGFALIPPLMGYTLSKVAKEEQTLAATANISAFGFGIALGIYLSGLAIDLDFGYTSPNVVGAALTTLGLMFFFFGEHKHRQRAYNNVPSQTEPLLQSAGEAATSSPALFGNSAQKRQTGSGSNSDDTCVEERHAVALVQ